MVLLMAGLLTRSVFNAFPSFANLNQDSRFKTVAK
jgi:hypothetical protein